MRNFTFTVVIDGQEEYLTYAAYSRSQAIYLLSLDGFSSSQIVDESVA